MSLFPKPHRIEKPTFLVSRLAEGLRIGPPKVSITERMSLMTCPDRDRSSRISVSWPKQFAAVM